MSNRLLYLLILISCLSACRSTEKKTLFELLPAKQTGVHFSNDLKQDEQLNILNYEYFYNGGGVGIIDINNDGLHDIVFTANMVSSKLYLNKGNLQFEDITASAGLELDNAWARGVSIVDINADGFQDIYVSRAGPKSDAPRPNLLYINQGNNTFKEQAKAYGLDFSGNTTQAAFFDYDHDGDLDCFLLVNVMERKGPNVIRPKRTDGSALSTDRLLRNNGNNTFTDVSKEANILSEGFGLGVAVVDVNEDGWPDIYVSNDYLSNDLLYINQQNGSFKNEIRDYFRHQSYSAMGNDAADIDNDGLVDFITLDMLPEGNERRKNMFGLMNYDRHLSELRMGYEPEFMRNTLQHNNGKRPETNHPFFSEVGRFSGIQATDWSWSALFADFDNDGLRDLMITNGYPKDITNRDFVIYRMAQYQQQMQTGRQNNRPALEALKEVEGAHIPNYLFKNEGGLKFNNESSAWGFDLASYSNGAAYADLDNDGDLDLVINNINKEAFIYQNHQETWAGKHQLNISLKGAAKNPAGIGAKVTVCTKKGQQYTEHSPYRGYQSTVSNRLHFGLDTLVMVDSVTVVWPDARWQTLKNIPADKMLVIDYKNAISGGKAQSIPAAPLFTAFSGSGIDYKHQDELYIDFKVQPLLPHLLSQNGPGVAVGDVNGDGLEDFFAGGAFNQSGGIFIQNKDQSFRKQIMISGQKFEEDMGTLLFDADGDGDLDLYIVSGSSEFEANSKYYQDRLYKNDGRGHFSLDAAALPALTASGSVITAADFDRDGDLDLFIGGRLSPGQYPLPGNSYVLRNDHGKFTDVTNAVAAGIGDVGMVTSAIWTDFDQDGWTDLIVAGEWMPLTVFKNTHGKLSNVSATTGLSNTTGWWNSLVSGDFDEDGDMDYIAGNVGLNSEGRPSATQPMTLFAKDFDNNGSIDPVLSHYIGSELFPVHPRDEMLSQMISLKKRFLYYRDYAKAPLSKIFTADELKGARKLTCEMMESVFIENLGGGKFATRPLPTQAQLGPVYGMVTGDYDQDGHLDVLLTGNSYAPESISGRLDAFNGLLLKGNGKGQFAPVSPAMSGFLVEGDGKGLAQMQLNNKTVVVAAQNNDKLLSFEIPVKSDNQLTIQPLPNDAWLLATYADGRKIRYELSYGSGYLSQSSRTVRIFKRGLKSLETGDFSGAGRMLKAD